MSRKKGFTYTIETRKKIALGKIGSKNPKWKGGIVFDGFGYVIVQCPNHPNADKKGYVREHRLVMEKKIGRYLKQSEIVHHKDRNRSNNDIGNLEVMKQSKHMRLHITKHIGCQIIGCHGKHRAKGFCAYHYNKKLTTGKL